MEFDGNLYDHDAIRHAIADIEANPVRQGLVVDSLEWEFSGARAGAGVRDVPIVIDAVKLEAGARNN